MFQFFKNGAFPEETHFELTEKNIPQGRIGETKSLFHPCVVYV